MASIAAIEEGFIEVKREDIIKLIAAADDQMLWSHEIWRIRDRLLMAATEGVSSVSETN